jgi:hypothetical protein
MEKGNEKTESKGDWFGALVTNTAKKIEKAIDTLVEPTNKPVVSKRDFVWGVLMP